MKDQPFTMLISGQQITTEKSLAVINPATDEVIANDSATFHLELENTDSVGKSVQLETTIRSAKGPDRIVAKSLDTLSLRPGVNRRTETLKVPDAQY